MEGKILTTDSKGEQFFFAKTFKFCPDVLLINNPKERKLQKTLDAHKN